MTASGPVGMVKQTFHDFLDDKALRLAAGVSYYTLISLAPLLLVIVALAGLIWGREAVSAALVAQMGALIGDAGATTVQDVLEQEAARPARGIIATVLGLLTLLFGASAVFVSLQDAMNTIWEVERRKGGGTWGFIRTRLLSLALLGSLAFLMLASLAVSTAVTALYDTLSVHWEASPWLAQALNVLLTAIVSALLFAAIFKVLPDVKIHWSDVWIGAVVTALLFALGKLLIGLYLGHSRVGTAYGAAGSVVVLMVWVYYTAVIFFLGAEFTQVYAQARGSDIRPSKHAVWSEDRLRGADPAEER